MREGREQEQRYGRIGKNQESKREREREREREAEREGERNEAIERGKKIRRE